MDAIIILLLFGTLLQAQADIRDFFSEVKTAGQSMRGSIRQRRSQLMRIAGWILLASSIGVGMFSDIANSLPQYDGPSWPPVIFVLWLILTAYAIVAGCFSVGGGYAPCAGLSRE